MQKLFCECVYTMGLGPASSTLLLILWRAPQPILRLLSQVAFTIVGPLEASAEACVFWKVNFNVQGRVTEVERGGTGLCCQLLWQTESDGELM